MVITASHSTWLWRHRVGICLSLILLFGAVLRVQCALPRLGHGRFWDERYNFKGQGSVKPLVIAPLDGNGESSVTVSLPPLASGKFLQALDLDSCSTSNVESP